MLNDIEYILDASILLNFLANKPKVVSKMISIDKDRTYLTPITIAEIYYAMLEARPQLSTELSILLKEYGVVPLNSDVAIQFAEMKHSAKIAGRNMDRDIWMVAFCKHVGATLLTTDKRLKHRLRHVSPPIEVIDID